MWKLVKHSIGMRRTQSVATAVTVALTVAVMFALALTSIGARAGLDRAHERLGADLMVVPAETESQIDDAALLFTGSPAPVYMDAAIADRCAEVPGVARVSAQFYGQTLDSSCCSASKPARLIGYDPATDWTIAPWVEGTGAPSRLEPREVVVGHDVDGISNGTMSILGRTFKVVARLDPIGADLDNSVLLDADIARELTAENANFAPYWRKYGKPQTLVSAVLVDVDDSVEEYSDLLASQSDGNVNSGEGAGKAVSDEVAEAPTPEALMSADASADAAEEDLGPVEQVAAQLAEAGGVSVIHPSKVMETSERQLGSMFAIMAGAAGLMALAALVQVFARFFGLAWDRRSELALYRALGASRGQVRNLIAAEALVLVGGGAIVGVALGAGLYALVPGMLAQAGEFPFISPGPLAWLAAAVALVVIFGLIGLIAVAVPVAKSNRIDPSSVMQAGDID